MKSFLIEIKAKDKSSTFTYPITSQDKETAEKWAEMCLKAQKKDPDKYRLIATEIIAEVEKPETPKAEKKPDSKPKQKPKKRFHTKNKSSNTMKQALKNAVKSRST